nr:transporter [Aquabacterium sp.]
GSKASVNAIGPAVAWLMNGGEMLIEGKFIKEFGAKNRTEGQAFWLTISKPL